MDTANKNKLVIAASSQDRRGVVRLCFMAWLLFYHYSITYGVFFLFELSEQDLSLDVRVRPSATPSDAATAAPGVDNVTAVGGNLPTPTRARGATGYAFLDLLRERCHIKVSIAGKP